jgi:pimeloyl-ACP methyl ester carboxylesterase
MNSLRRKYTFLSVISEDGIGACVLRSMEPLYSLAHVVVVYLHGFASSPDSSKAAFFAKRFAEHGVRFLCPDLNQPAFSTLTVTRMLQQLDAQISALPPTDVVLIGSSLGGFVAVEAAARQGENPRHFISRLILLAPAVELEWDRWSEVRPGGIEGWRTAGHIEVFHYAQDRPEKLRFEFYEDAERYQPATRRLSVPLLIFQGRQDESVDPNLVERFARQQSQATLHMLDDTHQLKNSLDVIWQETARFLTLTR